MTVTYRDCHDKNTWPSFMHHCKLAIHLSFLAFWHVRALFRELFSEIAKQSLYTSHNIVNFVHLWFCEKFDEKLAISSSLTFWENTDRLAITVKYEMRKIIGKMVYEMPFIHFSFLSFTIFSRSHQFDNKCIAGLTSLQYLPPDVSHFAFKAVSREKCSYVYEKKFARFFWLIF